MDTLKRHWWKLLLVALPAIWLVFCWAVGEKMPQLYLVSFFPTVIFYLVVVLAYRLFSPSAKARREKKREEKRRRQQTLVVRRVTHEVIKQCTNCRNILPINTQAPATCPHCGVKLVSEVRKPPPVQKRCGKCYRLVSSNAKLGQQCPHCGIVWLHLDGPAS